jgi:anti-anti-sigma factor
MVRVRGELDLATCDLLMRVLTDALDSDTVRRVEVDLADLDFLDASGVSALLTVRGQAEAHGKSLGLRRVTGLPLRVLEITGVLDLFDAKAEDTPERNDGD